MSLTTDRGAAILARTIKPEEGAMSPDAARAILDFKLSAQDAARVNELAEKARDGTLTPDERLELDDYEHVTALLELMQSKARLSLKHARLSP
jgi:hypothetical protein